MLKRNNNMRCSKKKKGQSTVEYIILVATILAALILFLKPSGIFQTAFCETLNEGTDGMVNMAGRLSGSHQ